MLQQENKEQSPFQIKDAEQLPNQEKTKRRPPNHEKIEALEAELAEVTRQTNLLVKGISGLMLFFVAVVGVTIGLAVAYQYVW